ncbi:coilin-like [Gigantopelta aegis]|uniref:coilin-like n=1 Tax=Gigantopelta aegis TaxID=1735272 RepID=UPI001B8898E6|nr:coilin-like [Gigantopelta aegis]
MAAPMEKCARIKLFFKHDKLEPSWLFVRTNQLPCVADIENQIRCKFDLGSCDVKLYLSGCILPKWESTELLHDNDAVDVLIDKDACTENDTREFIKQRKKKHKIIIDRKDDIDSEILNHVDTGHLNDSTTNTTDASQQKKRKRKHKSKKENDITELKDNDINSSVCVTAASNVRCSIENDDDILSEKKKKHKKRKKDVMEVMDSICQDPESSFVFRRNPGVLPGTTSNPSESVINNHSSNSTGDMLSPPSSVKASTVPVPVVPDDSQVKKKRTRVRKRKRKTSAAQQDTSATLASDKPEVTAKENSDWPVNKTVKLNLPWSKRPHNKRITFNDSAESNDEDSVVRTWGKPEHLSDPNDLHDFSSTADHNGDNNNVSCASKTYSRVEFSYSNSVISNSKSRSPNLVESTLNHVESAPVRSELANGVKVFTRKMPKRQSDQFREISKQEQLNTVATNVSVILKNSSEEPHEGVYEESTEPMSKDTNGFDGEDDGDMETVPIVRDYTGFPALYGPPRTGDKIAFKVLELSETYEPGISDYKEAEVLHYDPDTTMISLKILNKSNIPKIPGKFDITTEEDDSIDDGSENQVMHEWSSLLEPKLL